MINGNHKLKVKDIILSLTAEPQWLRLLSENGKPYQRFLEYFLSDSRRFEEYWETDYAKKNTVTQYAADLNEKSVTVNRWIREIYEDIMDLNDKHPERFAQEGDIICHFEYYSKSEDAGFWFSLGVECVPRVDDIVELYFLSAITNKSEYVVKEVKHRHYDGKMQIELHLTDKYLLGRHYRDLLIEKAAYLRLISISDMYDTEFHLDDKLEQVYKKHSEWI